MSLTRRSFLCTCAALACQTEICRAGWGKASKTERVRGTVFRNDAPDELWEWSKRAYAFRRLPGDKVICQVCPNACLLAPGDRSVCRSKINHQGTLYSLTYGNPCAVHLDPVEKKPLFHFQPGSRSFSIATTGCNFRCLNCQNWEISQAKPEEVRFAELPPEEVVRQALQAGAASIAYTYSEPITFIEYMTDTAILAREQGLANLLISNGFINEKPLRELCTCIQGANINLKAYSDDIYQRLNGGRLAPVLRTFEILHQQGVHFELTNLVVPGYTDDLDMARRMCGWILEHVGPDHPVHFLRFIPRYKLNRLPPTPLSVLKRFRSLALEEGLRYVYVGNAPFPEGLNTFCHHCGRLLVERRGYHLPVMDVADGQCPDCGTSIPGVWS